MADLIKKNNEPSEPNHNNLGKLVAAVILLLVAIFSFFMFLGTSSIAALIICGLTAFISFTLFITGYNPKPYTPESKLYGDLGERRTGSLLEKYLPDDYTVIQNAKVTYEEKTSEIDNIIVGKTGVFIVEVKNIKGTVFGDYEEKDWLQDKIDNYNYEHKKEFYNPVKQVGTHRYRLANYLRDNKVFTDIKCAVYFANPKTSVTLSGTPNDIPVFTYADTQALINYIMSGNENLSEKTINRIIEILK